MSAWMAELARVRPVAVGMGMRWDDEEMASGRDGGMPQLLRAGPLSAELDAGRLRYLRYQGVEIVRSLEFVVRDGEGEKAMPRIDDLRLREQGSRFEVTCEASVRYRGQRLGYVLHIAADDGRLRFTAKARASSGFSAGLAGLEILYPRSAMADREVQLEDIDGGEQRIWMPEPQALLQPLSMLHVLSHAPRPGLQAQCRLHGACFELLGQRHGAGGCFKIQARPLASAWPCRLPVHGQLLQMASFTFAEGPQEG